MLAILLKTLPFFAVIGLGYGAGRSRFFTPEATAYLTHFVFYFALSAMLFGFAANLIAGAKSSAWPFVLAYLLATTALWLAAGRGVALVRGTQAEEAVFEAHTGVIGNVGFLGIPMLALLLGPRGGRAGAAGAGGRSDRVLLDPDPADHRPARGPGRRWPTFAHPGAGPAEEPDDRLGRPGHGLGRDRAARCRSPVQRIPDAARRRRHALRAVRHRRLAGRAQRPNGWQVAAWLSFAKLVLHPAAGRRRGAAGCSRSSRYAAGVMIAAAALPVAGNVFILAQHYRVAPQRVSTAILMSTAASVLTVTARDRADRSLGRLP